MVKKQELQDLIETYQFQINQNKDRIRIIEKQMNLLHRYCNALDKLNEITSEQISSTRILLLVMYVILVFITIYHLIIQVI